MSNWPALECSTGLPLYTSQRLSGNLSLIVTAAQFASAESLINHCFITI